MARSPLIQICDDLGIDHSNATKDKDSAVAFAGELYKAGMNLSRQLEEKSTAADIEIKFKAAAYTDSEALHEAELVIGKIYDLISGLSPNALANLQQLLPELSASINSQLRSHAYRASGEKQLTKKHMHEMYIVLKSNLEKFRDYVYAIHGVPKEKMKSLPSKPGNYTTGDKTLKAYRIYIDNDPWLNPFEAARYLGFTIAFYMDIIDMIRDSDGTLNGHSVRLEEI